MSNLLIGADPELFVKKGDNFISGHIFECGTKENPMPVEHGSVQVDGVALEFNVIPSPTKEEFIKNVHLVLRDLRQFVSSRDESCTLVAQPSVDFTEEFLRSLPEKVAELGCNPDYNAYTMMPNDPPDATRLFRTGAGHIHVGWTQDQQVRDYEYMQYCCRVVKQLDYFLGLPSLYWDSDIRRRELYGQAGCFRPKSYGVEYRVLSNAWVGNEHITAFIYDNIVRALELLQQGTELDNTFKGEAAKYINSGETNWAKLNPELAQIVLVGNECL